MTLCIPGKILTCCSIRSQAQQLAWREKFTLFILIILLCALVLFYIIGFGMIICPRQALLSQGELEGRSQLSDPFVSVYGGYYKIDEVVATHTSGSSGFLSPLSFKMTVLGRDVSAMFVKQKQNYCPGFQFPDGWDDVFERGNQGVPELWYQHSFDSSGKPTDYLTLLKRSRKGLIARDNTWINELVLSDDRRRIIIAWGNVYDISSYYDSLNVGPLLPIFLNVTSGSLLKDVSLNDTRTRTSRPGFFGPIIKTMFDNSSIASPAAQSTLPDRIVNPTITITDSTALFDQIKFNQSMGGIEFWTIFRNCMDGLFFAGVVDHRNDLNCQISNYMLMLASAVVMLIIGVKFIAALRFGASRTPEDHQKFVICQVPCYTEGVESLFKTLSSLAKQTYDDRYKLIFVICDGMVVGAGNKQSTPKIVLDILGVDNNVEPPAVQCEALGPNHQQYNRAKVYSGLYDIDGHIVPFIVVVKVGREDEITKPGNRGKRDSQLLLMRFLSRVHVDEKLNELECHLMHHMKNVIGVPPNWYEYILMVDADTQVFPESLNRLIS
ncbi:hypothetical protein HK096_007283, partial [Nowakowskiella sp. JEL0078]